MNLTKKTSEITIQLTNGLDLNTISSQNKVTVNTIKYHIKKIKKKMKLASTYELYQFAHMLKSLKGSK
ncbi:LuxR C-terminal-related transcriptional regulator [Raoultella ornithinolytica]